MTAAKNATQTARPKTRPWTSGELEQLRANAQLGAAALADLLDRPVEAVRSAAKRQRISLRQPGERRGLLLGQPAGTSWEDLRRTGVSVRVLRAIRDEVLAGLVNLTDLDRRARELARDLDRPLCPRCLERPQRSSSGLCEPCHLRGLAEAHRDDSARRGAQRDLWRARQRKVRGQ